MYVIEITVETEDECQEMIDCLDEIEEEEKVDFPFNVKVTEIA